MWMDPLMAHPLLAVFRDWQAGFLGCFVQNIDHATPLEAEFSALMFAIEKAVEQNLSVVWLDSDSLMVVNAFNTNSDAGVPWRMRVRWNNCKQMANQLGYKCSHAFREGNMVADALAKNGQRLALCTSQWWKDPPQFILSLLSREQLGLPFTRFTM